MILTLHTGDKVSVAHLVATEIKCPCTQIRRELSIRVAFKNHCYTEEFSGAKHSKEQILLYDAPDRPRVFCPIRHALSHKLPALIAELPKKKVHQTSQTRNYVYVVPLAVDGQIYQIYFMLQRAQPEDTADLRLTVESAYPAPGPLSLPKRPNQIRFFVLAYKILTKQEVKFAAR